MSTEAQKLSQSLKKRTWFPVLSLERKTIFWAGSQFYVEMRPALLEAWSLKHQGEPINYDDDNNDDDDDDDDDDNNDGNGVFFFINIFNRPGVAGAVL